MTTELQNPKEAMIIADHNGIQVVKEKEIATIVDADIEIATRDASTRLLFQKSDISIHHVILTSQADLILGHQEKKERAVTNGFKENCQLLEFQMGMEAW